MFKRIILKDCTGIRSGIINSISKNQLNKVFYGSKSTIKTSTFKNNNNNNNNSNSRSRSSDNVSQDDKETQLKLKLYREKKLMNNKSKVLVSDDINQLIKGNLESSLSKKQEASTTASESTSTSTQNQSQSNKTKQEDADLPNVDYEIKSEIAPGIFITPALSQANKISTIVTCSFGYENEAKELAKEFGLDFLSLQQVLKLPSEIFTYQLALFLSEKGLSLHSFGIEDSTRKNNIRKLTHEIFLDYTSGAINHRTEFGQNKRSPLIRSIKINSKFPEHVMDVTGGLGKDAWQIASMGCKVTVIERNPVLIYMMQKALETARANTETSEIASRITLIHKDSIQYLTENINCDESLKPDVIYMDPMYPGKKKDKSLSKKDIIAVRTLVGGDRDSTLLFALSRRFTKNRVSWKRPKDVIPLIGSNAQFKSSDTIYYVYLKKELNKNNNNNNNNSNNNEDDSVDEN